MNLRTATFFLLPAILLAQSPDARIQRLVEAAHLWGRVKWVHPALAEGKVNWDKALVEALPDLAAANTEIAQKAALEKLLAPLRDPALTIGERVKPPFVSVDPTLPMIEWLPGQVALLHLHCPPTTWAPTFEATVKTAQEGMLLAKGLVIDLRPSGYSSPVDLLDRILPMAITQPLALPGPRYLFHCGYPPQSGSTSGGYYTAWMSQASNLLRPDPKARPMPMAFIANEWTDFPPVVMALQKAGLAYLIAEGTPNSGWVAPTESATFGELTITYSAGEMVFPDGLSGMGADRVLPADTKVGPDTQAVQAALALLASHGKPGSTIVWQHLSSLPVWAKDPAYADMAFPSLPWRQFAVIRFWSVIDAFFPYKDLMDKPWETALPEFLARMDTVKDAQGYALTLAEMACRLQDNHVVVSGSTLQKAFGEATLPIKFTSVQGKVVVDQVSDSTVAKDVHRWDEVLEVDGEPIDAAIRRLSAYIPAANSWTQSRNVFWRALGRGPEGTFAQLKIRGADQLIRSVAILRTKAATSKPSPKREGQIIQVLPGNIGYADLDRLEPGQVNDLFLKVKDTKALILDMRGYPHGTAWPIAPHLNVKKGKAAALFSPCVIQGGSSYRQDLRMPFIQMLPEGDGTPPYRGKVVMLINEQTQSQAEHSGLFFETACDITFVGSPSAGSNGDVTNLLLPGGIRVSFTGQSVRHADGRQLQRVGLQPQVGVSPTLDGLRHGKDEVLDRAIQFLENGR